MAAYYEPKYASEQWAVSKGYNAKNGFGNGGVIDYVSKNNLGGEWDAYKKANNVTETSPLSPGVTPLTVAGQNKYQQDALYNLGQGTGKTDPRVSNTYDTAKDYYQQAGSSTFNPSSASSFENPYIEKVINSSIGDISRIYDKRRNELDQEFAAAGGFGSKSQGVERANLKEAEAREVGSMSANLRSQGYTQAMNNALGLYSTDNNKAFQAGSAMQGLGSNYLGLDQYTRERMVGDLVNQLTAGDRIQQQNQTVLDSFYAERDKQLGFQPQQLSWLAEILSKYPTGQQTTGSASGNPLGGAMGGAMLGYGLQNAFSNSDSSTESSGRTTVRKPGTTMGGFVL